MTASTRRELRSAATSTSTTAIGLIRALTDARPIKPTSTRCLSARRPNPAESPLIDAEILFRQPQPPQTSHAAEPYCHGAPDSKPRGPRQRAHPAERAVLRPAGQRWTHYLGSNSGHARGPGLYQHAGYLQRRTGRRLEMRNQCSPCLWRPDGAQALAFLTHIPTL